MSQTLSPPPAPILGAAARQGASLAKLVGLGPTYGKILFLIGGFIDAGHPTPSWSELARLAKVERTTIRNAINECERRDVLVVDRPGAPEPDRYELQTPRKPRRRPA